jgi:hypothetical protein
MEPAIRRRLRTSWAKMSGELKELTAKFKF